MEIEDGTRKQKRRCTFSFCILRSVCLVEASAVRFCLRHASCPGEIIRNEIIEPIVVFKNASGTASKSVVLVLL